MIRKEPSPSVYQRFSSFIYRHQLARYRYLIPIFFVGGVTFELVRVFWRPLGVNFYDVFLAKRKRDWYDQLRRDLEKENFYRLADYENELKRIYGDPATKKSGI